MNIYFVIKQSWGHYEVIAAFSKISDAITFTSSMSEKESSVSLKQIECDKSGTILKPGQKYYKCYYQPGISSNVIVSNTHNTTTEWIYNAKTGELIGIERVLVANSERHAKQLTIKSLQRKLNENKR